MKYKYKINCKEILSKRKMAKIVIVKNQNTDVQESLVKAKIIVKLLVSNKELRIRFKKKKKGNMVNYFNRFIIILKMITFKFFCKVLPF